MGLVAKPCKSFRRLTFAPSFLAEDLSDVIMHQGCLAPILAGYVNSPHPGYRLLTVIGGRISYLYAVYTLVEPT